MVLDVTLTFLSHVRTSYSFKCHFGAFLALHVTGEHSFKCHFDAFVTDEDFVFKWHFDALVVSRNENYCHTSTLAKLHRRVRSTRTGQDPIRHLVWCC